MKPQKDMVTRGERLALKLVSSVNKTSYKCIKLTKGLVVHRAMKGDDVCPCSEDAVHAYATLRQASTHYYHHCSHGPEGHVWLVAMRRSGLVSDFNKLAGKSYRVIRYLGHLNARSTARRCKALGLEG